MDSIRRLFGFRSAVDDDNAKEEKDNAKREEEEEEEEEEGESEEDEDYSHDVDIMFPSAANASYSQLQTTDDVELKTVTVQPIRAANDTDEDSEEDDWKIDGNKLADQTVDDESDDDNSNQQPPHGLTASYRNASVSRKPPRRLANKNPQSRTESHLGPPT